MNIAKKAFCRTFQTVFHLALPFLPYREPKILGGVDEVPGVLKEKGIESVLLVTDAGLRGAGCRPCHERTGKKDV